MGAPIQAGKQALHRVFQGGPVLHRQLGRDAGRRRPDVRREIGQGKIRLMADGRNHRHGTGGHGPDDGLFVKGPEVLQRAASAADDDHIHPGHLGKLLDAGSHVGRRSLPLHQGRAKDQLDGRIAPPGHLGNVVDDRAGPARDHPDHPGQQGQGALFPFVKQAFQGQALFQLLQFYVQCAQAVLGHLPGVKLVAARGGIEGYAAPQRHPAAVRRGKGKAQRVLPEHHALDARLIVL